MSRKGLVLLSGGLDSCVAAAMAREDGIELVAGLNVMYGQKHKKEKDSFKAVADHYGMQPIEVDLSSFGKLIQHSSALLNPEEELPKDRRMSTMTAKVPRSYVPGRNTIMLALAQSLAEALDLDVLVIGTHMTDSSGYPDAQERFVLAWNHLARYATRKAYEDGHPIEVFAPVIQMSKTSVVYHGKRLQAPLQLTWSCYQGGEKACGRCDSCIIRWNAFVANQMQDEIEYELEPASVGL